MKETIFDKIDDFICHRLNHTNLPDCYHVPDISNEIIEFIKNILVDAEVNHPKELGDHVVLTRNKYCVLENRADQYSSLIKKIEEHQGNEYDEETESFIDNPDCDLMSIGELVLTELDMWR